MSWFSGLWDRAKEWFMSKLPVQDIYNKMGVKPQVSVDMQSLIDAWKATYQGHPSWKSEDMLTLSFPSIVCWDIAKKAIGELEISASLPTPEGQKAVIDENSTDYIKRNIRPFIRSQVEYGLAMGGIVARPWYDQDTKKTRIGFYTADNALPTKWDGKKMTGVILIDQITKNSAGSYTTYTKLESIEPSDSLYDPQTNQTASGWMIKTRIFKSTVKSSIGQEITFASAPSQWAGITPDVPVLGNVCPFAYMGTPWANNQDLNSPQGTSIFRDAMENLEELDRTYTNLSWEIEAGKAALFIDESLLDIDESGNIKETQTEKRLYRKTASGDGNLLEPYNPPIRIEQLNAALKTQLSVICMLCHLDAGAYVYDAAQTSVTATEVRTKQQQTYGTILDIQDNMIRPFIKDLIDTVRGVQILYVQDKAEWIREDIEVGIDFGDSILVDEETDRATAQSEVSLGLRSKLAYLMEWRGMTEAHALAEIKRIQEETPVQQTFFGA